MKDLFYALWFTANVVGAITLIVVLGLRGMWVGMIVVIALYALSEKLWLDTYLKKDGQ